MRFQIVQQRIACIIFYTVVCYSVCSAQQVITALPRWMATGLVSYNMPQSHTSRFIDHNNWGYQVEFQYRLQYNKPFLVGAYFHQSTLSKYILKYTQSSGNGDIEIREKAATWRIEPGLSAGFYPEVNWLIQPYLTGRIGLSIFQTSSILKDRDSQEIIDRISESSSVAPAYGLDFGFHIVPNIWYIRSDIRFGYSGNTSAGYMILDKENAGETGYPIDYFLKHTSAGKWLKISAGISYLF